MCGFLQSYTKFASTVCVRSRMNVCGLSVVLRFAFMGHNCVEQMETKLDTRRTMVVIWPGYKSYNIPIRYRKSGKMKLKQDFSYCLWINFCFMCRPSSLCVEYTTKRTFLLHSFTFLV